MKLIRVEVHNYRSLFRGQEARPFVVDLADGVNAFVGPNNCGKSNLFRAIALALDETFLFDYERDKPEPLPWAFPRVTLTFQSDGRTSVEKTLLRYLSEYEQTAAEGQRRYADSGEIRLFVQFQSGRRVESFVARGAGARRGDRELLDKALHQFHKAVRFVYVPSGQSLHELLKGRFREILQSVIQDHLHDEFEQAERDRDEYMRKLQTDLLNPLRERLKTEVAKSFADITDVNLSPSVPRISDSLSDVAVRLVDAVDTDIGDKGTGVRGAVLVAMLGYLAAQSRRSLVIAIEEPESFLHPAAQIELSHKLESLAERDDLTLLMTTHSPFVVSRDPRSRTFALDKDGQGRTRLLGQAQGNEPQAELLGGLFDRSDLPMLLDRLMSVPETARGLLIVEGITDAAYLRTVAARVGRPCLIEDLQIIPAGGANRAVDEAVFRRAHSPLPIMVLLDRDQPGREAKQMLVDCFRFQNREHVTLYSEVLLDANGDIEAEDLFPTSLLAPFVAQHGNDTVLDGQSWRRGEVRYEFNKVGKELLPAFVADHCEPEHCEKWVALLEMIRSRMAL